MRWAVLTIILLEGMSAAFANSWKLSGDIFYYENGTKKICKHIEDNGTIWLGETITKYYKVDNCSNLPVGGVHLVMNCYKKDEDTLEISTKVWCDNYTPEYNAYYFNGMLNFDNELIFPMNIKPGQIYNRNAKLKYSLEHNSSLTSGNNLLIILIFVIIVAIGIGVMKFKQKL